MQRVKNIRTLLIGESWMIHTVEAKGFDTFSFDSYGTGIKYIQPVLSEEGFEFVHMPCHRVEMDFPRSIDDLMKFDVIIISDIGANTFLLPIETFSQFQPTQNKLAMLKEYVLAGGGLLMAGGYLSFMGIEGKGKYYGSIIEDVLPVSFLPHDDRMEHPEGLTIEILPDIHQILNGLDSSLHGFFGYNKAIAKADAHVIASVQGDPLIALGEYGKGRSIAFATDIAPHWASPEFCQSNNYRILWKNMVRYLARQL